MEYLLKNIYIFLDAVKFEEIESFTGIAKSLIECANFASIHNRERMNIAYAINAFKFETQIDIETCVIGKIPIPELGVFEDRNVTSEKDGIYLMQGCRIEGIGW